MALGLESAGRVHVLLPEEFFSLLEELDAQATNRETTVRGYKVKVRYKPADEADKKERRRVIAQTITTAMRRLRDRDKE